MLLAWDVKNGVLRFYVDGKVEFNDQSTQHSVPFPGGHLILGQSQNSSGSINESASLNADIKHFNMWQHMFTEQEALKIYSDCNVQIGTLVPWPEMQVALHGAVTRTEFNVSCLVKGMFVFLQIIYESIRFASTSVNTVKLPVSGYPWGQKKCPVNAALCMKLGTRLSVRLREVSAYGRCPLAEVRPYTLTYESIYWLNHGFLRKSLKPCI